MKLKQLVYVLLAVAFSYGMTGCGSMTTRGDDTMIPLENVTVTLAPGRSLANVVTTSAAKRRWTPQVMQDGKVVRCTLIQRDHRVVADVVIIDEKTFSVRCVESNIPVRKYNQWANNLMREIVVQAGR